MSLNPDNRQKEAQRESSPAKALRGVLLPAVARLGLSVFVFGAMFLLLMAIASALLSPDRFPVRLKDRTVRFADLTNEQDALSDEYARLFGQRTTLEQRLSAPVLRKVESLRSWHVSPGAALLAIYQVRSGFSAGGENSISLPQITFDEASSKLTIEGEVRDPQGRSVQLLASFVDGLRGIPIVASVTEPEYRSTATPSGGSVSPFSLSLTLQRDR